MAAAVADEHSTDFESIKSIFNKFKNPDQRARNLDKVNIHGVVTYITQKEKCVLLTLCDESCDFEEKLKCNVFSSPEDRSIADLCRVGDILRLHRIRVQEYKEFPHASVDKKISSWICFKRDSNYERTEKKCPTSNATDYDLKRVSELREWLKTNPQNKFMFEAGLSVSNSGEVHDPTVDQINQAAAVMNMETTITTTVPSNLTHVSPNRLRKTKCVQFSGVTPLGNQNMIHYDIACQVCAICKDTKGFSYLIVWDGTKSNLAVYQDSQIQIEITANQNGEITSSDNYRLFFSKSISDYMFHVWIFDEFVNNLTGLQPGDYIMMKNMRTQKPNNIQGADMLFKMPGAQNTSFANRSLTKLCSYADVESDKFSFVLPPEIESLIKALHNKGKAMGVGFISIDDFLNEINKPLDEFTNNNLQDDTLDELMSNQRRSKSPSKVQKSPLKKVVPTTAAPTTTTNTFVAPTTPSPAPPAPVSNTIANKQPPLSTLSQVERLLEDRPSQYSFDEDSESENGENEAPTVIEANSSKNNSRLCSPLKRKARESLALDDQAEQHLRKSPRLSNSPSKTLSISPSKSPPKLQRVSLGTQLTTRSQAAAVAGKSPVKNISNLGQQIDTEHTRVAEPAQVSEKNGQEPVSVSASGNDQLINDDMEVEVVKEFKHTTSNCDEAAVANKRGAQTSMLGSTVVSQDIFKIKRLVNWTFIVPFMQAPNEQVAVSSSSSSLLHSSSSSSSHSLNFVPFFNSLDELIKVAAVRDYMKCKVSAKLYSYAGDACPSMASVYVLCKKCSYVNFTPFHLLNIYHLAQLNSLQNDVNNYVASVNGQQQTSTQLTSANTQSAQSMLEIDLSEDYQHTLLKQSANFSLDWLRNVFPASTDQIPFTQAMTQSTVRATTSNSAAQSERWIYEYSCPRCKLNNEEEEVTDEACDSSVVVQDDCSALSYIYRFWFVLRDSKSQLTPCLIEGDLALKFLKRVEPIKFYTDKEKAREVYQTILNNFNKKFLFTVETFKLSELNAMSDMSNTKANKNLNVLYKIVDMEELVSI